MTTQEEAIELIRHGDTDAEDLLNQADARFTARFKAIDKSMVKLMGDIKKHFPDATYYTASGGFHVMLGNPHGDEGNPQQELVALSGKASIQDGDF